MTSTYKEFISLIPALSKDKNFGKWIDHDQEGNLIFPYYEYSGAAEQLCYAIEHFSHKHFGFDAGQILGKNHIKMTESDLLEVDVNKLDSDAVMACLVWILLTEKFCEGFLLDFLRKGTILKWLKRLKELEQ